MALVLDDRVKETSTTTSTGTLDLSGAVSGFQTFVAGIGDGNTTYYAIVNRDAAEWETGLGTITDSSTDTLARTTVIASSNSDSAVDFSAGTKDVFTTLPASKVGYLDGNNNFIVGKGAAGVDYTLTFDGADSDGVITWMEDEDHLKFSDDVVMDSTKKLYFYDKGGEYISSNGSDLSLVAGDDIHLDATGNTWKFLTNTTLHFYIESNSGEMSFVNESQDLDQLFKGNDGGNAITALKLDMSEAGAATFNDKVIATELDISGNMDIDGTSNLDAVDIDGAVQIDGTVTVGVDGTGLDVKMFGTSAGAYALWDESANLLDLRGATAAGPGHLKLTTGELTVVDADVLGKIEFQAPLESDGTDAILVGAAIWAEADDTFAAGVNNTDLVFALGKSEAAAEKFRFTADNEIGIAGANYGTDGQVLTSGGEGAACAWEDVTGSITALNNQAESRLVSIGSTTTQLDGEANLTFTGSALTCIGTMTVGVDGTGHDVQFFGATAGAYMLWDENTDDLVLAGAANLYLYDAGGGESLSSDGTDLTINSGSDIHLTATDDVNIPSGVGLTFAATEKIESDGTDLSITVGASGDVNIPADIGLTFGDDGEKIEGDGSDLTISGNTVNLDSSMNHTFSSTGKAMVLGF